MHGETSSPSLVTSGVPQRIVRPHFYFYVILATLQNIRSYLLKLNIIMSEVDCRNLQNDLHTST